MKNSVKKLTPFIIVVLGFFTLGITDLIWIYSISDRINAEKYLPMKQVALTMISLGIYGIFWTYKLSSEIKNSNSYTDNIKPMICTILSVIFLRNISTAMIYNAILSTKNETTGEQLK